MLLDEPAAVEPLAENELLSGYITATEDSSWATGAVTLFLCFVFRQRKIRI